MSADPSFAEVLACLTSPRVIDQGPTASTWQGTTLGLQGGTVFGGQLLGQTVSIAARLDPAMPLRSLSVVFPRAVRDTGTVEYTAATMHRGSAYSTQRIELQQPDRSGAPVTAFSATALCHQRVESIEHHAAMPEVGGPQDAAPVDLGLVPWECRVAGGTDLRDRAAQPNELHLWTRVGEPLADELAVHQALLAFATDLTLIGTALLPHEGWSQLDAHVALRTSVIAHHLWFHRPLRIDDWLLLTQTSPAAADGTAFGSGHVFTERGELVASYAQEAMIRVEAEHPR